MDKKLIIANIKKQLTTVEINDYTLDTSKWISTFFTVLFFANFLLVSSKFNDTIFLETIHITFFLFIISVFMYFFIVIHMKIKNKKINIALKIIISIILLLSLIVAYIPRIWFPF